MKIEIGTASSLGAATMTDMACYRHAVFVERLGWKLQSKCGLELDQFDRTDTRYVVARAEDGHVIGVARLLPTTSPYLLGSVFLQLMDGAPLPCASDTWELSRFAVLDPLWRGTVRQFDSRAAEVLDAVLVDAANHGVTRLVTVSPLGVERLLRRCGFRAKRAGSPRRVGADHLFACWIDVPFVAAPAGTRKRAEPLT